MLYAVLWRRFTKGNQKPGLPSGDVEQSAAPRRGLFKRLQDKIKTPGKDSPRACLTVNLKLVQCFDVLFPLQIYVTDQRLAVLSRLGIYFTFC